MLIGTVKDAQGAVIAGAAVRVESTALIGGRADTKTDEKGQLRFAALPIGDYTVTVESPGFTAYRVPDVVRIGAGATLERNIVLDARRRGRVRRGPGFGIADRRARPRHRCTFRPRRSERHSDAALQHGRSDTSRARRVPHVTGQWLDQQRVDLRIRHQREHVPDRRHQLHVPLQWRSTVRARCRFHPGSADSLGGRVSRVRERPGGHHQRHHQAGWGPVPVRRVVLRPVGGADERARPPDLPGPRSTTSTYERAKYRDLTANAGGPAWRNRLWFFAGYQHLRDYDSQPGTDPAFPRTYEQDKFFGKLTWRLSPTLLLVQSFHTERWVNPEIPTYVKPFEATQRLHASVPAMTFGHLTHTLSSRTVWDVRVGRFVYTRHDDPSTGDVTIPSRIDRVTEMMSGAPQTFGGLKLIRTTAKGTVDHYRPALLGADHHWRVGGQLERGEHHLSTIIPTGRRYIDEGLAPFRAVSSAPSIVGGVFVTASGFVSHGLTIGSALTINTGVRFDHSRAISQDLRALDTEGRETRDTIQGLGLMYTWNVWSPRFGLTLRLTGDGRTVLRGSFGRFHQGMLTGELAPFHPGATAITTTQFESATGAYTREMSTVDPLRNLEYAPGTRTPYTDAWSVGLDRQLGRSLTVAIALVHKRGADFIGWTDIRGAVSRRDAHVAGRNPQCARRNQRACVRPDGDIRTALPAQQSGRIFDALQRARARGRPTTRQRLAGSRVVHVVSDDGAAGVERGQRGGPAGQHDCVRALSDVRPGSEHPDERGRPAAQRLAAHGACDGQRRCSANGSRGRGQRPAFQRQAVGGLGHRAAARAAGRRADPAGAARPASPVLADARGPAPLAPVCHRHGARVELLLDVFNVFNDTAEEGVATDNVRAGNFGQPTAFVDPRRAMVAARFTFGK